MKNHSFQRILQQATEMAALPSVLTFEDKCAESVEGLKIQRDKYFSWAETYQNPLSQAYKSISSVAASKSILFHVALKHNLSLRALAQDPNRQLSNNGDILIAGADLKLDADFSYKLSQQVDLTSPYNYDYITFSTKAHGNQVNPDGFVDVFSSGLWLWLWLSAAICTGVIYAVSFSFTTHKFELNFRHSVAFILKSFIIEGHRLKEPKPAVQVFASFWAVVAFLTSTIYLSVVVSSVLSPDSPPPTPETFEDIVKAGMKTTTEDAEYENVVSWLEGSGSDAFKHLAQKMSKVKYIVDCLDAAVIDTNTACVAKFRGMQSFLEAKYIDKNGHPKILVSKYRSSVIWTGYAVRKKSQFEGILSNFIGRATAAGLQDHWTSLFDHGFRRWGIGLALGDLCSNRAHLYELWYKVGDEMNKNNPNKHILSCLIWRLPDFLEIWKKNCVRIVQKDLTFVDAMLRVEHLIIVFKAMCSLYSLALVGFVLELVFKRVCPRFKHRRQRGKCLRKVSILVVKSMESTNKSVLPYPYYW